MVFPCALIAQGEVTRLVPDEREDETQNCKCLGKCQAHEGEWLQLVLEFRLACDTLDEGSEHEAHAKTTTDGGEALDCAINVTEVKALTHDFKIVNGKLLLNVATSPDTVQIMTLSADSLVAKGTKQVYRLGKK